MKKQNDFDNMKTTKRAAVMIGAAALMVTMGISAFAAQDPASQNKWDRTGIGIEAGIGQGQGRMNGMPSMGQQGNSGMNGQNGQRPENFGSMQNGQRPELPAGRNGGQRSEDGKAPMDDLKEKIDALSNTTAKTKLNKLVSELEEAMEAEHKLMEANRPEIPEKKGSTDTAADNTGKTGDKLPEPAVNTVRFLRFS